MLQRIAICLVIFVSQGVWAAGDAGCGLGSVVWKDNAKLLQLFAITTNGTFSSQIFGITSGTSNCSARGIVMQDKAIRYFVEANHEDLSREIASGSGEKLTTLASLYGCDSKTAQTQFAQSVQGNYGQIVPVATTSADDMVKNLNNVVKHDASIQSSCVASL